MNGKLWKALRSLNLEINAMPYRVDLEMYGKLDYWNSQPADAGDCDDYACQKRFRLRGLYPDNLDAFRLATCWVEGPRGGKGRGGYHAVLIVHTDKGEYVLDNRQTEVTPWRDLPYRWHKMEQPGQVFWVLIKQ